MPKPSKRLAGLEIEETSGVDKPANLADGWVVIKSWSDIEKEEGEEADEKTRRAEEKANNERRYEIKAALRERMKVLGRWMKDEKVTALAEEALADESFAVENYDERIKAASSPVKLRETTGAPKADEKTPAPKASLGFGDVPPERQRLHDRNVEIRAIELVQQGFSGREALLKAEIEARDLNVVGRIRALARSQKIPETEAAKVESERLHREYVKRKTPRQRRIDPQRLAVAEMVKTSRVAKGLTQNDVAQELGVTDRAVQRWEAGDRVPEGLLLWRLGSLLDFDLADLRKIAAASNRAE